MRFKILSSLRSLSATFLKKPFEQPPFHSSIFRLVNLKRSSSGQLKLVIQVIGKSVVVEYTPQEIVANDQLLEGFSKKDIRYITYLACEQNERPRYKIVMQEFCERVNRILFKLKKYDSNEFISKTAGQISLDKNLISNLSREDICSIVYTAGYEQSFWENVKKEAKS